MGLVENLIIVFVAGLLTALATGLGALPFFVVDDVGDRWNVALWGLASGIMVSASVFGLLGEGLANGTALELVPGLLVGVALVEVADRVLDRYDVGHAHAHGGGEHAHGDDGEHAHGDGHAHDGGRDPAADDADRAHDGDSDRAGGERAGDAEFDGEVAPLEARAIAERNWRKLALILGILTVHSFPEGVAIGVSFADLGLEGGLFVLGLTVPVLAVFMTVAISIHNVPEGLAISIPLRALGVGKWRMVGAAVFSSLPQPIGAVIAFVFVRWAREFIPFGFGFAAGAMIYLVLTEFIPEGLETGADLPNRGYAEMAAGLVVGVAVMVPLAFV